MTRPLLVLLLILVLFSSCLTVTTRPGGPVTAAEARSLVAAYISHKAWDLEPDPTAPAPVADDRGFFHFWVILDPETGERMDFFVERTTGDLYETPVGPRIHPRAVLEELRSERPTEEAAPEAGSGLK